MMSVIKAKPTNKRICIYSFLETSNWPKYRKQQLEKAWFDPKINSWNQVTTLSKENRKILEKQVPWYSFEVQTQQSSQNTTKTVFKLKDDKQIESVLMPNPRGHYTACLSSQVGCAMACDFCATGTMGFKRNLTRDEIIDQFRYWQNFLKDTEKRVSNIVMMGMGEPLNNYEALKDSLHLIINHGSVGPTKITVSSVGVKRGLEKILSDKDWPDVKMALSLHYPTDNQRAKHMPVNNQYNLSELKQWCKEYLKLKGNRNHYITFEYLILPEHNDSIKDVENLVKFLEGIDRFKINLIPWNEVSKLQYSRASAKRSKVFQNLLLQKGIRSTLRKSLGRDIDGGCGQLVTKPNSLPIIN